MKDCEKMSRVEMFCYSATRKQKGRDDGTVARVQKDKKKQNGKGNSYIEAESTISLEKYNKKLMNAIWGSYNR